MFKTTMGNFSKNEDCPTSAEIFEFETGDLTRVVAKAVRLHLAGCEFCSAEAEFYSRYPHFADEEETAEPAKIPEPLFQLAEALLKPRSDDSALDILLTNGELLHK